VSGPDEMSAERAALLARATTDIAVAHGVIVKDCLVIDGTGNVGRVIGTYGDAFGVEFPGNGHREIIIPANCLRLAADQDWEPEGGWGA
jgi:hypothetical protein